MKYLRRLFNWLFRRSQNKLPQKNSVEDTKVSWITIDVPNIVMPEQIYEDIRKPFRMSSLVLLGGMRRRIGQEPFSKYKDSSENSLEWNICFCLNGTKFRLAEGFMYYFEDGENAKDGVTDSLLKKCHPPKLLISYQDFLRHELLLHLIELIMKTPFLAMLADLDKSKDFKSWYQKFIVRIGRERNEAMVLQKQNLTDVQLARVVGVLKRLELFEAELEKAAEYLRQYCRDSIAYIESMRGVIEGMVNEKRVALLEKNTHLLAQEATEVVREKYDALHQHALAVNNSLKVFGMSEDVRLGELTHAALESLERGSAQLKSNLDEIHKVYFGNAIVEITEKEREKVTT